MAAERNYKHELHMMPWVELDAKGFVPGPRSRFTNTPPWGSATHQVIVRWRGALDSNLTGTETRGRYRVMDSDKGAQMQVHLSGPEGTSVVPATECSFEAGELFTLYHRDNGVETVRYVPWDTIVQISFTRAVT